MNVEFDASFDEVAELFEELGEKIYPQVERSALNDAAAQARTAIRKKIKDRTGVPSKALNKRMKLHRANRRISSARIFIGTMPISIYHHLNPTELKRGGVSYKGASGRAKLPGAFIARTQHGPGVFTRVTKKRFPLKFETVDITGEARSAAEAAQRAFPENFRRLFASKFGYRFSQAVAKRRGIRLL